MQLKFLDFVTFEAAEDLSAHFEFIELFWAEECLWKVKLKDYYNRSKKDVSYRTLIGKVQEVEPDATRDTVVKKIKKKCVRKETKKF